MIVLRSALPKAALLATWTACLPPPQGGRARARPTATPGTIPPEALDGVQRGVVYVEAASPEGARVRGTGLFVDDSGSVLTARHVIAPALGADGGLAGRITVRTASGDLTIEVDRVLAVDASRDLALIAPAGRMQTRPLALAGTGELRPTMSVWAVGYPAGWGEKPSWYEGRLRGLDTDLIEHSVDIRHGHSGGPLVSADGRVLGVNVHVQREELGRMNFAVRADVAAAFVRGRRTSTGAAGPPAVAAAPPVPPPSPALRAAPRPAPSRSTETMFVAAFEYEATTGPYAGDIDVHVQRVTRDGLLTWTESAAKPKPVAHSRLREASPVAASDGAGGAIVAFVATGGLGGSDNTNIFAQRILADGTLAWNEGRSSVSLSSTPAMEHAPVLLADGRGGAFAVFEILLVEGQYAGDTDLFAQRITPDGQRAWNDGRQPAVVSNSPLAEKNPALASDGAGGFFVVFEATARPPGPSGSDVFVQRLSADGQKLWPRSPAISSTAGSERNPVILADGQGGAFVVFEVETNGDVDLLAQKLSQDGPVWNAGRAPSPLANSVSNETDAAIVLDGAGGIIVAFELEYPSGPHAGDADIFAQRLSPEGTPVWNPTGSESWRPVSVSSAKATERNPTAVPDGAGGAIVVFEIEPRVGEHADDTAIFAQRVSPDGRLLWNEGSRSTIVSAAAEWREVSPVAVADGQGGAVVFFDMIVQRDGKRDVDINAQRIGPDGRLLWLGGSRSTDIAASSQFERRPSVFRFDPR